MTTHLSKKFKVLIFYLLLVSVSLGVFFIIRQFGEHLSAPLPQAEKYHSMSAPESMNMLLHVLLAIVVIIITARTVGILFGWIKQPAVIGEIIGGIFLGPSLLGRISPHLYDILLPSTVAPFLSIIAQIGVILYIFLVGLELDLGIIKKSGHETVAISHASILLPFLLGSILSLILYPIMSSNDVPFTVFTLFMGVSMSVTAFPVLARILTDREMNKTSMGSIALSCAAVDDVTAWCLLAFVVSIAQSNITNAIKTITLTFVFIFCMFIIVRPLIKRFIPFLESAPRLSKGSLAIIFAAMLLSALFTEYVGIHALFGAFLLGALIPQSSKIASELTHRLQDVISVLFLPVFFAFSGMRTQIGLVSGFENWVICIVIALVACIGKFGGTFIASRLVGLSNRQSSALGILMNTRGLVELIVLNIGFDLKVITPTLFTMLVLMALITTFMTTPILHLILRNHPWIEGKTESSKVG
jgi:Kef-type K+ transport system membrane component KefB